MSTNHTPHADPTETLEVHRLAVSLIEAAGVGDDEQAAVILAAVAGIPAGGDRLLVVLASLVGEALRMPAGTGVDGFTGAVRAGLDAAEQKLRDGEGRS